MIYKKICVLCFKSNFAKQTDDYSDYNIILLYSDYNFIKIFYKKKC